MFEMLASCRLRSSVALGMPGEPGSRVPYRGSVLDGVDAFRWTARCRASRLCFTCGADRREVRRAVEKTRG